MEIAKRIAGTGLLYIGASWISHDYNPLNWDVLTILFSIMIGFGIWDSDKE